MDDLIKKKILVYPTDTVWGIGGDIFSKEIYEQICNVKKISKDKPFSLLFFKEELLLEYINISKFLAIERLRFISKHEVTFAFPIQLLKKKLPFWCTFDSSHIFVRLLSKKIEEKFSDKFTNPIFSTSLNHTGQAPLVNLEEAKIFFDEFVKGGEFLPLDEITPSGESSSIIKFDLNNKIETIRSGRFIKEILELL